MANVTKIRAIKTLQRKLGMDDLTYRDGLERLTGKRSSTQLTDAQLGRVLNWLRGLTGRCMGARMVR